ncbi:MAG: C39 family peptidase [Tissierellales bacterium]|nr:C39 family peptidase [Tissierellales bacterium]MBN2826399.1 C39 family peptidase [Tissierellales bacterium]
MIAFLMVIEDESIRNKLTEVYELHNKKLIYIANNILHDKYEAEDAVQEALIKISEYIEFKTNTKSGGSGALSVPVYEQEYDYYCGPASVQMVVKYEKGIKYSQDTLASDMNTNSSDGTYVYKVTDELNSKIGANSFQYIDIFDGVLENDILYSIDHDCPLIYQANRNDLEGYVTDGGHFIVGYGYEWYASGASGYSNAFYIDSYGGSSGGGYPLGTHSIGMADLEDAIDNHADYYIRKYASN